MQPPHVDSVPVTTATANQQDHDDYTGLPGWYLKELLYPRLAAIARAEHCTIGEAATKLAKEQCDPDEFPRVKSHLNYLMNDKIGIVGLRVAVRLLELIGLEHHHARDDMWVPTYGRRPPIRMAGDELFAANAPVTRQSLAAKADELARRRDFLLSLRPRPA